MRFVRIKTKHLEQNEMRTICGLAKPTDGRPRSESEPALPNPPQGARRRKEFLPIVLGAGPKEVHFWWVRSNGRGSYISVWEYFRKSEFATWGATMAERLN